MARRQRRVGGRGAAVGVSPVAAGGPQPGLPGPTLPPVVYGAKSPGHQAFALGPLGRWGATALRRGTAAGGAPVTAGPPAAGRTADRARRGGPRPSGLRARAARSLGGGSPTPGVPLWVPRRSLRGRGCRGYRAGPTAGRLRREGPGPSGLREVAGTPPHPIHPRRNRRRALQFPGRQRPFHRR